MDHSRYEAVIGLEVHCQLDTKTKIFCSCPVDFGAPPNAHACPVCAGLPGALPVLNERAVALAVSAALALDCRINLWSRFARKNYFYPDLPKGYQITQFDHPLASGGGVEFDLEGETRRVDLIRIHMEEDAGKCLHEGSGGTSLVDLNRAGTPLIEIVGTPGLHSAAEAVAWLRSLHGTLVAIGVTRGNMEEGNFRCDANVSVRKRASSALGTRVELKNLNSFRFLGHAIDYEIRRQIEALEDGRGITQETRLWNVAQGRSEVMRDKEEAHDYRYFPEPDLKPLVLTADYVEDLRRRLPELPRARAARFRDTYGLSPADVAVLTSSSKLAEFFERAARGSGNVKAVANWIMVDLVGALNRLGTDLEACAIRPEHIASLVKLLDEEVINNKMAKQIFGEMLATGRDPAAIVQARGLRQVTDPVELSTMIDALIEAHPSEWAQLKGGKQKVMAFFVGRMMKATKGRANPAQVNALIKRKLSE